MTPQQIFAIQHFMSQYPEHVDDFQDMLSIIANADETSWDDVDDDDDMPIIWEPFDRFGSVKVAEWIECMADDLTRFFKPKE